MRGYFASPAKTGGKLPGIVVIHENRGLNPYIEDVSRRLAVANFLAFAPDALTPLGGYPGDDEKAGQLFAQRTPTSAPKICWPLPTISSRVRIARAKSAPSDFASAEGSSTRLPCECRISAQRFLSMARSPALRNTAKIKAPLLIHYAALDDRVNAGWPAFEAALKANGAKYQMYMYPNTNHGFHNDTTPRYDEAAGKLAWSRSIAFFKENLES